MWISLLDLKRAFVIHLLLSHHSFVAGFGAYIPDDDPYEFVRALDCPEYVKAAMCRAAGCQWDKPTGVCTHWPLQNSLGKITPPKRPEETLTPTTYPSFPPTPVKTKMPSIWTPSSRPSLLRPPTKNPTRIPTEATSTTAADEPASTTAAEVMLGHKASKCIDQCSSKDYQGVKACEKHYQIEGPNGCDTAKYAANIDGYYSGYNEKCHACKYDQTWGLCSEKSSCDDSDAIQEDSNGVCCCGGTDEFGVKESCMYYNDEWRFR